tara:strand:- start:167 stop:499 length:333 start_codon:yes stop_codon:yes gene_type:complete
LVSALEVVGHAGNILKATTGHDVADTVSRGAEINSALNESQSSVTSYLAGCTVTDKFTLVNRRLKPRPTGLVSLLISDTLVFNPAPDTSQLVRVEVPPLIRLCHLVDAPD